MIFYFSGTGNSLYVARKLAKDKEAVISIAAEVNNSYEKYEYTLKEGEAVGFVYPIYAWAPPKTVLEFIEKIELINYKNNYIFTVATCGGNIGNTIKLLDGVLKNRRLKLDSGFSIVMPNNYMIMGNVDTKETEQKKLAEAEETLKSISKIIEERKAGVFEVVKGFFPALLTSVINPLFNMGGVSTKKFYADKNCNGCGICESVCSCNNIKVSEKPIWGNKCVQCLACINLCPMKAVQFGKVTEKKGRYKNPNISLKEMKLR